MLSPVIAPKPQRLRSPRMSTEEKKLEPVKSAYLAGDRNTLTPGSHDACREVERIMQPTTDEQKSPIRPKPSYPQPVFQDVMYSPPLRSISPPTRAQNPQAAAAEAYWREHRELMGTKEDPQQDIELSPDHHDHERDEADLQLFRHSLPLTSNHSLEPSSPFSAPPSLPSLELTRHYSLPQGDTPNRPEEDLDYEDTLLFSPNFYEEFDREEQDRLEEILTPPFLTDYSPYHLPIVNSVNSYDSCQHSPNLMSSRPIDIPTLNRGQSLPTRVSASLSTVSSGLLSSKRKRGKPSYASRSLPSEVDLFLQIRRVARTQSDAR